MKIKLLISIFIILPLVDLSAQSIDSLKLINTDLPKEYSFTNKSNCISIQASILYDNPEIYESIIGKIKRKDVQNFLSKKDNGSIMYFEFEGDFNQTGFLEGLLWGGDKPTKEHPEKYKAYKNILIIWSFNNGSPLEKISENKIKKLLH